MNTQHVSTATATVPHGPTLRRDPAEVLGRSTQEPLIRRLGREHLPAIEAHLLALQPSDRHCRFHALLGNDAIRDYVARIDFERMILVGALDDSGRLVGLAEAHLDTPNSPLRAEVSVSVSESRRGQGLGRLLTAVALDAAAARGTRRADFYYQTGNRSIGRLVRELGAPIATAPGYASLALPLTTRVLH